MLPFEMIGGGNFTLTTATIASGVNVEVQSQNPPDFVVARALTKWGQASTATVIEWWWEKSLGNGYAKGILQSSEGSTPQLPAMTSYVLPATGTTAVDAISCYDTANPPTYAALTATAITGNAGTFVVSMSNTGTIAVGDYVRLYGVTGEQQISTYPFQVTAVTVNTSITLGYMASSGITFAADATAAQVVKYIPNKMYPRLKYIANITQAAQAVVYFTATNDFTVGEIVSFRIPSQYGMTQLNNKTARVLAVTNSSTVSSITLDLNTTGYTAFAFPTSATAAAGVSPAICVPSSSGVVPISAANTSPVQPPGTNLLDSFDNRNVRIIRFGSALWGVSSHTPANNDVWMWQAFKYSNYSSNTITL